MSRPELPRSPYPRYARGRRQAGYRVGDDHDLPRDQDGEQVEDMAERGERDVDETAGESVGTHIESDEG